MTCMEYIQCVSWLHLLTLLFFSSVSARQWPVSFIRLAGSVPVTNLGKSKSSNERGCNDSNSLTTELCRHQCDDSSYGFAF